MDGSHDGGDGAAVRETRLTERSLDPPLPGTGATVFGWLAVLGWLVVGVLATDTGLYLPLGLYGLALVTTAAVLAGPTLAPLLRPTWPAVVTGVLAGAVMAGATLLVYGPAAALLPDVREAVVALHRSAALGPPAEVRLVLLVVIIAAEEVLWRGLLLTRLRARYGRRPAVIVCALAYGVAQLGAGSLTLFLLAVACGIVWGTQRLWHGSLVVPFLTHLVWDLTVLVIAPVESPAPFLL